MSRLIDPARILIAADVARGRTLTSRLILRTDLVNADAHWVDEQIRVGTADPNALITSRKPDDLPAFDDAIVDEFAKASGKHVTRDTNGDPSR